MEKEERFNLNELIKKQIDDCFNDNLMETLNAALIFKYVDTLQQQLKKQKEIIDKVRKIFEECKMLSPHEFDWEEQVDNVLNILNEE